MNKTIGRVKIKYILNNDFALRLTFKRVYTKTLKPPINNKEKKTLIILM